jgi:hypothetical protein
MQNFTLVDCHAYNSGKYTRYNDWVCGFDLSETPNLENLLVLGCTAAGSWETGFHMEHSATKTSSMIVDCISTDNGLDKPIPMYGAGFLLSNGMTAYNLISRDNALYGFEIETYGSAGVALYNCRDDGSAVAFYVNGMGQSVQLYDCESWYAQKWALQASGINNGIIDNFRIVDPVGSGDHGASLNYWGNSSIDFDVVISGTPAPPTVILWLYYCEQIDVSGRAMVAGGNLLSAYNCKNITLHDWVIYVTGASSVFGVSSSTYGFNLTAGNIYMRDVQTVPTLQMGFGGKVDWSVVWVVDKSTTTMVNLVPLYDGYYRTLFSNNKGVATVTGANSSVTVDHLLYTTPTIVFVTCNNTGAGNYSVSSITPTQFVISFTNQPGTNEWLFYWYAEV